MIAGGLFDSDEMIQKAFEISIKAIKRKISVTEHARDVVLTSRTQKVNKNAFQVANIGTQFSLAFISAEFHIAFQTFLYTAHVCTIYLHSHYHARATCIHPESYTCIQILFPYITYVLY